MEDRAIPLVHTREERVEDTLAVCLSGGGYRAMLYHLGSLWYLHDANLLRTVARISSVSGGSITAGLLGLRWNALYGPTGSGDFQAVVVEPIRRMASTTIDVGSVLGGIFGKGSISDRVIGHYRKVLFDKATLQDLPDLPRFVINATNVQTGSLFRFSKPYIGDWQVGRYVNPTVGIAEAVTASSAFPPVLSPARLSLPAGAFTESLGKLARPPFTTDIFLTDGGVYDNMGLETAWKRCARVLVSDGGGKMQPQEKPHTDWARHSLRVNDLIDNQVRSLRKRQLISSFLADDRRGAYWGMWTDPGEYPAGGTLSLPADRASELAHVATRLEKMPAALQERLINFGYGMADRAVRSYYDPAIAPRAQFPYPNTGI